MIVKLKGNIENFDENFIDLDVNDEENAKKLFTLLDKLEDLDDVQTVASNFNIDEELLKKVIQ